MRSKLGFDIDEFTICERAVLDHSPHGLDDMGLRRNRIGAGRLRAGTGPPL